MKTLVVLAALTAVAIAGPTFRADDTDLDINKVGKRSPTLGSLHHHHVPSPAHIMPVHHTYVQPVIPHHLGLKKPLIVKHPYGHHLFRSDDEEKETHSAESKESKNKCMKEMEAKCDDGPIAKSSESVDGTKVEDIDGDVSDTEVAQSLQMAKEAVATLQKKLQLAEKNTRMTQWKHGLSEADGKMHENVETAKLALEHMQRNFGNLESMNVHARAFTNEEVHDVNLELKTDEERLAQWKDAIESIQKNVELVRNIEGSFQQKEHSEKSAALDQPASLKHEISDSHQKDATPQKVEKTFGKSASIMSNMDMDAKSTDGKSSWQARQQETSSDFKNEMDTSASTLSETKSTLHSAKEPPFRSENSQLEKGTTITSGSNVKLIAEHDNIKASKDDERSVKVIEEKPLNKPMESISKSSLKSSENLEMLPAHLEHENIAPIVDTTTLMKSAEHHSITGPSAHKEHDMGSHLDHHRSPSSMHDKDSHQTSLHPDHSKAKESEALEHHGLLSSVINGKDAHEIMLKSSDQMTGQSQQIGMVAKPVEHLAPGHHSEKLHQTSSVAAHGKSAEDGSLFAPIDMNSLSLRESLVPTKSWKSPHSASRGAYGSGLALGGSGYGAIAGGYGASSGAAGYGASSGAGGYGGGSGAVGVFPNARVGGCAIPLLLSCSPSVVAGSLAKGHSYAAPSYASPAYRSENTNSHSKRDITKIIRPTKLNRTPANKDLKQKTILITEKL